MTRQHITDESVSGRKYFHTLLNMVDDDLNPYQYRLYGHYVRVAGEHGACYESVRTTARITRMSPAMVVKTRNELTALRFIECVKSDDPNETIAVTVVDRWADNIARYSDKRSPHKQGVHQVNTGVHDINTGVHQESLKKNSLKKNSLKKNQTTTTGSGSGELPAAPAVLPPASTLPEQSADSGLPASKVESSKEEKGSAQKEESVTVQDDGLAQVITAYESNIGAITPLLADTLKSALDDYAAAWIVEAIGIAVKSEKRFWRYVEGILKRWKRDGKDTPVSAGSTPAKTAANGRQQQYVTVPAGTNPFTSVQTKGTSND